MHIFKKLSSILMVLLLFTIVLAACTAENPVDTEDRGTGLIAFASEGSGNSDIWLMDAGGGNLVQLTDDQSWDFCPAWSPDGTKIAFSKAEDLSDLTHTFDVSDIWLMDADGGNLVQLTDDQLFDSDPTWSPDGAKIAFHKIEHQPDPKGNSEIWVMDADGGNLMQLTDDQSWDSDPTWSPDGSLIAFTSNRSGDFDIWLMDADGGNLMQLTNDQSWDSDPTWSPDGSQIAFRSERSGNFDIWLMDADGGNLMQLTDDPMDDFVPTWSSDGTKIAFTSSRSGNFDIWLMDADGGNLMQLTDDLMNEYCPSWTPALGN